MRDLRSPLMFEPTVAGQRVVLPRRGVGKGSFVTFLFGLAFAGVPGYFLGYQNLREMIDDGAFSLFAFVPMLFCLPFVLIGGALVLSTLGLWLTRTTIRIEGDELIVKDGLGPFGLTRRRHADDLAGFKIDVGASRTNGGPSKPMDHFASLTASLAEPPNPDHGPDGKKRMPFAIAIGYPRDLLHDLADQLAEAFRTTGRLGPERELTVTEDVKDLDHDDDDFALDTPDSVPDQPADSTITIEAQPHGVTYHAPAKGVVKGSSGFFTFGLIWNAIVFAILGVIFFGEPTTENGQPINWSSIVPILIVLAFVAVGVGMMYAALRMGTRHVTLKVLHNDTHAPRDHHRAASTADLFIEEAHLFGKKQYDLPAGSVAAIRVGHSGMSNNDEPVNNLRVTLTPEASAQAKDSAKAAPRFHDPDESAKPRKTKAKTLGFFTERDDDELRWLAARLRADLNVPRNPVA